MKKCMKKLMKIIINCYCKIINHKRCVFKHGSQISMGTIFGGNNLIGENTKFVNSSIGYSSYISHYCDMPNTIIGKFCSIGKNVKVIYGSHPTKTFVSTSPLFYSTKSTHDFKKKFTKVDKFEEYKYAVHNKFVQIGNDVWIGDNVSIMQGVKINDGAIIGANSIVTKDILPYAVAVGNPAKIIKYRFNEKEINSLMNLKWWDKDIKWIESNSEKFENIEKLIGKIENGK